MKKLKRKLSILLALSMILTVIAPANAGIADYVYEEPNVENGGVPSAETTAAAEATPTPAPEATSTPEPTADPDAAENSDASLKSDATAEPDGTIAPAATDIVDEDTPNATIDPNATVIVDATATPDATVDPTVEPMPVVVDVPLTLDSMPMAVDALPKDIGDETVTVDAIPNQTYDAGKPITPTVTVRDGDAELTAGTDYTVSYDNNINAGTATVTITGMGNYTGSRTVTFTIEAKDIDFLKGHYSIPYTGSSIWADMMKDSKINIDFLRDGDYQLKYGVDFTMDGSAETSVGRLYSMDVFGIGNYTGYAGIDYSIVQLNLSNTDLVSADITCTYNPANPAEPLVKATVYVGKQGYWGPYALPASDYTVTLSGNVGNAGEDVRVTIEGIGGNCTGEFDKMVVVQALDLADAEVSLEGAPYTYTGSAIEPKVTVTYGGVTLAEGTDYKVLYADNVNAGKDTATVTIKPADGNDNIVDGKTVAFTIEARPIQLRVLGARYEIPYTGDLTMSLTFLKRYDIYDEGGRKLEFGKDYLPIAFNDQSADAGSQGAAALRGIGNYTGSTGISYTIRQLDFVQDADIISADIKCYSFGGKIVPQGTVHVHAATGNVLALTEGTDYTLSCEDTEANVGDDVTVTITGRTNCTGTLTQTVTVQPLSLVDVAVSLEKTLYAYDGSEHKPAVTVTYGGVTLIEGTDYKVSYEDNTDAGKAIVMIEPVEGNTNITSVKVVTFAIERKDIGSLGNIGRDPYEIPYTGTLEMSLSFLELYYEEEKLELGKDWEPVGVDNQPADAGSTGVATLEGVGNYTGSVQISYEICQLNLEDVEVSLLQTSYTYDGSERKPEVIVTYGGVRLTEGRDYTVRYENNVNAGTAKVIIEPTEGNDNIVGSKTVEFTIERKDIGFLNNGPVDPHEVPYTGSSILYDMIYDSKINLDFLCDRVYQLKYGVDYEIQPGSFIYSLVGSLSNVIISGIGNYTGEAEIYYEIVQLDLSNTDLVSAKITCTYNPADPANPLVKATVQVSQEGYWGPYTLPAEDYTVEYTLDSKGNVGDEVTVTIKPSSTNNCTNQLQQTVKVQALNLANVAVSFEDAPYTYTGSEIKPEVTVTYGGVTLTKGTDYTVSYANNVNAGEATVTIEPVEGNMNIVGSKMVTFTIERKDIKFLSTPADNPYMIPYTGDLNMSMSLLELYDEDEGKKLELGKDYRLISFSGQNAYEGFGDEAYLEGMGNYRGDARIYYMIRQLDFAQDADIISADIQCYSFGGKIVTQGTVQVHAPTGDVLALNERYDYRLSCEVAEANVGDDVTVTITGTGTHCIGTLTQTVKVQALDLANVAVSLEKTSYAYDGSEHKPAVTVTYGGVTLAEGTDYMVLYANNVNAGTAKVTITGIGNCCGTVEKSYTIAQQNLSGVTIAVEKCVFVGEDMAPELSVNVLADGVQLVEGIDYSLSVGSASEAGDTVQVLITAIGDNYTGELTKDAEVARRDVSDTTVIYIEPTFTYSGNANDLSAEDLSLSFQVGSEVVTYVRNVDYTVSYDDNVNVGTVTATIQGIGNLTGSFEKTFKIEQKSITSEGVTVDSIADQTYTGAAVTPEVIVRDGKTVLTKDKDYTVAYANNVNVGEASVTITGTGNYTSSREEKFEIVARSIASEEVTVDSIADQTYTGAAVTPEVIVRDGKTVLTKDKDYTVSYANNLNVGTASVTITGKGNYTASVTVQFEIVARSITSEGVTVDSIADQTYTGVALTPEVTVRDGKTVLTKDKDYTVSYANNLNVGTATVTITGIGNYTGNITKEFEIAAKDTASEGLTVDDIEVQTYTGEEIEPELTVRDGDKVLVEGEDYVVTYEDNENAGTASVTITGIGNYTGSVTKEFEIAAKDTSSEGLTVDSIAVQTYTGAKIRPELTVRDGDKVLVEGVDYVVTYEDNRKAGTATVTITGIGNYSGTLTVTFEIKEKKQSASLTYAQQAAMLAAGTAVEGLVTNRSNAARSYVPTNEEVRSEETGEIIRRTLVFTVAPAQDAEGEIVYRDGVPVYKQRNLHLAKGLVDALVELGYTNIRFVLKDATLEWALADMNGENNVIRFAPMEEAELTQSEREALGEREALSDCYRVRITAEVNSETVDVTGEIASLTVCFDGAAVRELAEDEAAQCLQVPGNEKLEPTVSDAEYVEEEVRPGYRAALSQSGLLVLILH